MDLVGIQNEYMQVKKEKNKFRQFGGGNPPFPLNDHHRYHDGHDRNNRCNDRGGITAGKGAFP